MFWKRKQDSDNFVATTEKPAAPEVKNLSPKEKMEREIRRLEATEYLTYRLAENYAGGNRLAIVELDPQSTGKKKQYTISIDMIVHEKPAGDKVCVMRCDDPDNVASWINKRRCKSQN